MSNLSDLQIPPPDKGEKFEKLCLDLYKAEFGNQTQRNGRSGQAQNGVDIFAPGAIGIQCKKRDIIKGEITEKELKAEVQKAKDCQPPIKRFILAATCKRDAKIQKAARLISKEHQKQNLFSVEIHSWEEIKALFDKYPEVYNKHYPQYQKADIRTFSAAALIKSIQSESRHQELNKIRNDLNANKPQIAFTSLEQFKQEKWDQLEDKEKYRVLTDMAFAKIEMKQEIQAAELFIKALQFNKKDERAASNCALACLINNDIKNAKKFIKKVQALNPLNTNAYILEIQIKDRERKDFWEIVSALPESVKTKPQTAHILSYISLKRKLYKEAEKYLEIFYNNSEKNENGDWKEIKAEASCADMSLRLILERQEVFSSRRVPENLKDRLDDIINIYKKLNTDKRFSELREFNPDWPRHYALALELKGDIDEAVFILQKGVKDFKSDDLLKIELSRLLKEKGDIENSAAELEKLFGLSFSASGGSSDSINKKPLLLNKMNVSEKSFNLALILTDLYFRSDQKDKAWSLLDKTEKASSLTDEQRLEARQYRIFRLINFGKTEEAEEKLNLLYEEDGKHIINLILKSKIENAKASAKEASAGKTEECKSHRKKSAQYLKEAVRVFKDKSYKEEGNQHSFFFENRERLRDLEQLAQELYNTKMYEEAEPLLEEITNKNLNHPEIFKLLNAYYENGKNKQLIDLAEALIKKFPDRPEPARILFHLYQELGNIKKAVQYYENFIRAASNHAQIIPVKLDLIHAYINNEQIKKASDLLNGEFNLNSLSPELISHLSIAYAKTGNKKKAVEIQYQNIKKNPGKMELENVYFNLLTFLDKPQPADLERTGSIKSEAPPPEDAQFLNSEKAGLDCYVQIKDIKSEEEQDIIIEENAEIYTPEHELSQILSGKKAGDKISFAGKTYQIREIKSKYVHKYQEIIKKAELQYGSKTFLKSAYISKEPDIYIKSLPEIVGEFLPDISKRQESVKRLFRAYREGKVSVGFMAKTTGRHPLETMGSLISSEENKWISAFQGFERYDEAQKYLENKSDLLLDLFSLVMIHQIKMEEILENSKFDLYVCQSSIDSLKEYIGKINLHSKDGLLEAGFDGEGALRTNSVPSESVKQHLNFCVKVKIWAEERCRIQPVSSDFVLKRKERRKWEQAIGKEFLDPLLALYNNQDIVFLSEDAALRALLRSVHQEIDKFQEKEKKSSPASVRLFDLIECLKRKAVIERKEEIQFKAGLIKLNQTYIPIDHNILLFLLKEAEYSISDPRFQRGLFFLGPVSDLSGAVLVTADFFIDLCQEPSLSPYRRQMIINETLNKVSFGRKSGQTADQILHLVQRKTYLLPLLQNDLYSYIMEWRKSKIY